MSENEKLEDKINQESNMEKKEHKVASFVATAGLPLCQITFFGASLYGLYELNASHPLIARMFFPLYFFGLVGGMVGVREGYIRIVEKIANHYYGCSIHDKSTQDKSIQDKSTQDKSTQDK